MTDARITDGQMTNGRMTDGPSLRGWRLPITLAGICLVLATILAWELIHEPESVTLPPREIAGASSGSSVEMADAGAAFVPVPLEELEEMIERPLFMASRRPAVKATPTGAAMTDASVDGNFVLAGVIVTNQRRVALVRTEGAPRPVRVEVGQDVNGWVIDSITPTRVVFRNGDKVEEISLDDRPRPQAAQKPRKPPQRATANRRQKDRQ